MCLVPCAVERFVVLTVFVPKHHACCSLSPVQDEHSGVILLAVLGEGSHLKLLQTGASY